MEKDWIAGLKKGDMAGFQEIVKSYQRRVFSFAYSWLRNRADAEDAVQEVFWRVLKYIRRYDENKPFSTWVFAVAMNVVRSIYRRNKNRPRNIDDDFVQNAHFCDGGVETAEDKLTLYSLLDGLGDSEQDLFYLRYMARLRISEIAQLSGESEANVKTRLYRLREKLEDHGREDAYVEKPVEATA